MKQGQTNIVFHGLRVWPLQVSMGLGGDSIFRSSFRSSSASDPRPVAQCACVRLLVSHFHKMVNFPNSDTNNIMIVSAAATQNDERRIESPYWHRASIPNSSFHVLSKMTSLVLYSPDGPLSSQGVVRKKIKHPGSDFFLRPLGQD